MALRSVPFWAVFAMWGFGVIGYQIVTTHQVAHALDRGFSAATLGWVFGLGGACTVAGNVIGGFLSDRWGREWVFALGSAIGIAGIGCLGWLDGPEDFLLLLGYVVAGVGFGMRISLLAAIPADLFAGRHLGVILGAAQGGGGLGGFIGPFLGGWLFDVTGSYQIAFAVAALAIAASAVAAWVAAPRRAGRRGAPPAGSVRDAGERAAAHARSDTADADVSLGVPRVAFPQRAAGLLHAPGPGRGHPRFAGRHSS